MLRGLGQGYITVQANQACKGPSRSVATGNKMRAGRRGRSWTGPGGESGLEGDVGGGLARPGPKPNYPEEGSALLLDLDFFTVDFGPFLPSRRFMTIAVLVILTGYSGNRSFIQHLLGIDLNFIFLFYFFAD